MKNPVLFLRRAALVEGISFLLLVGVAMPLKYVFEMPRTVTVVGWVHGVLFIVFCIALAETIRTAKWPLARAAMVLAAGLLPFGPFLVDRRMLVFQQEFEEQRAG